MKKKLLYLAIIPLLISACNDNNASSSFSSLPISSNNSSSEISNISSEEKSSSEQRDRSSDAKESSEEEKPVPENHYRISFDSILLTNEDSKPIKIKYDIPDNYLSFNHPSSTFKKELALTALAFVSAAPTVEGVQDIYTHYGFDDLFISDDYALEEYAETVKFTIGHKKNDDVNIVNLSISGYQYAKPWESNLTVGINGEHSGFYKGAFKVFPSIITYLKKYQGDERTVLFINGYSRSAAIANVLSGMLIENKIIEEKDLYVYSFETPCGFSDYNTHDYVSVFNIVNSADLVTHVAPKAYNLIRVGHDIELYKDNADAIINEFNKNLVLPKFTPTTGDSGYSSDEEFVQFIISTLLEPVATEGLETPSKDISTRENFYKNLQGDITYLAGFIFGLSKEVTDDIMNKFKGKSTGELLAFLKKDALYDFIKDILKDHQVSYEEEKLRDALNSLVYLLEQKPKLLLIIASSDGRNNLMRSIYFHTLEAVLPLLINL